MLSFEYVAVEKIVVEKNFLNFSKQIVQFQVFPDIVFDIEIIILHHAVLIIDRYRYVHYQQLFNK